MRFLFLDSGIGFFLFSLPFLALELLVFVSILEAFVFRLTGYQSLSESLKHSFIANFVSTLVGAIIFRISIDPFFYVFGYPKDMDDEFIPILTAVIICTFLLTLVIEYFCYKFLNKNRPQQRLLKGLIVGNILSYLCLPWLVFLYFSYI